MVMMIELILMMMIIPVHKALKNDRWDFRLELSLRLDFKNETRVWTNLWAVQMLAC